MYSCHLFLISSASVLSIPFLSFTVPIFAWNIPLGLIFLRRSLDFSILLFPSVSLHWSLRKAFSSLLAILWNSAFIGICLSFSPLPLASLLSSGICKPSSDNHFAFLHYFFLRIVSITASCTRSQISVHSSSGTLSGLMPWFYLSLPLYNCKGFNLGRTWMVYNGLVFFPPFFNLHLNFAIRSSWSGPQSAPSLVFADCTEIFHLQLKEYN